jgi:hypothetical protein
MWRGGWQEQTWKCSKEIQNDLWQNSSLQKHSATGGISQIKQQEGKSQDNERYHINCKPYGRLSLENETVSAQSTQELDILQSMAYNELQKCMRFHAYKTQCMQQLSENIRRTSSCFILQNKDEDDDYLVPCLLS